MRELREETGLVAEAEAFSGPFGESVIRFEWGEYDITQDQTFFAVYVGDVTVSFDGMEAVERETTSEARWWSADEILKCPEVYHPENLDELIREAVLRVR